MKIGFITIRNIVQNANLKRAAGMAPALRERGHDVTFVMEEHPNNHEMIDQLPGVESVYFPAMKPRAERRWKQRWLNQCDCDVVVVCGLSFRNTVSKLPGRQPAVILDHPEIYSTFADHRLPRRLFEYAMEWWALRSYDGHLAVSRYLEQWLNKRQQRLRSATPVLYSPFAVDDQLREHDPAGAAAVNERYRGKVILYVGSFFRPYGFYEMLEAARQLAAKRDDFTLVMAGAGPEEAAGREFVKQHRLEESVRFVGFLSGDELSNHLYGADAFVCPLNDTPRDWARSPGKIYMYGVTGHPIVTCRVGEAIVTLGDGGYYYEEGSAESLAEQMERALTGVGSLAMPREDLFWDARTEQFLDWLASEFSLPAAVAESSARDGNPINQHA